MYYTFQIVTILNVMRILSQFFKKIKTIKNHNVKKSRKTIVIMQREKGKKENGRHIRSSIATSSGQHADPTQARFCKLCGYATLVGP
jgi:hypothetical protein